MWAGLKPEQVSDDWGRLKPFVEKGLARSRGEYTAEDVLIKIAHREMQLWAVFHDEGLQAIVITEILYFPNLKTANLFLAAGQGMAHWGKYLEEVIEPWAKSRGCVELSGFCRAGMAKTLEKRGWTPAYTVMRKAIA